MNISRPHKYFQATFHYDKIKSRALSTLIMVCPAGTYLFNVNNRNIKTMLKFNDKDIRTTTFIEWIWILSFKKSCVSILPHFKSFEHLHNMLEALYKAFILNMHHVYMTFAALLLIPVKNNWKNTDWSNSPSHSENNFSYSKNKPITGILEFMLIF